MTSTYTPSLRIQEISNGDQSGTWGTTTNTNWELMEQAVAGVQTIAMSNANYTMTDLNGVSDEARNMVIVATGSLSAPYKIIAPLESKIYVVTNSTSGGFNIYFGGATGAYVTIPNGYTTVVYGDGTNFYAGATCSSGSYAVLGNLEVTNDADVGGDVTVAGDTILLGNLSLTGSTNIVPVGSVINYPSSTPPSGFLLCNGQAVSRGTYASLFALVGTTFGSGDGSTTFNLPNIPNVVNNVYYCIKY